MTSVRIVMAALLTMITSTMPATAALYDLKSDWSDTNNPNGVWTFRDGSNTVPFMADWTVFSLAEPAYNSSGHIAQPVFAYGNAPGDHIPAWFRATVTPSDILWQLDWQSGDIVVHTTDNFNGPGRGDANVLWTSPTAGNAHIFGNVWDGRTDLSRPQYWELWVTQGNLAQILASGFLAGNDSDGITRATPAVFDFGNVPLSIGDEVMLRFYRAGEVGDFIGTNLTIAFVPESGTLLLIVIGLFGLRFARNIMRS